MMFALQTPFGSSGRRAKSRWLSRTPFSTSFSTSSNSRSKRTVSGGMTIRRILIANRGEIAVRIIRTAHRLGIETVLAVSEADRDSLGARQATRAVCIGPGRPADSYLRVETIVQAALGTGLRRDPSGLRFPLASGRRWRSFARLEGVIFIGRPPRRSRRLATSCARASMPRRPMCRSCRAARWTASPKRRRWPGGSARRCW